MELRFLGSGDAFGSGGRFQACLAVRAGPDLVLVDCGASSLVAMRRFGVDDKPVKYHLDYRTLMQHRAELGCRRLVLTHLSEDMLARLPLAGAEWAEDGATLTL